MSPGLLFACLLFKFCLATDADGDDFPGFLASVGDNKTALHSIRGPHWVSSPGFRGTSNILWSCTVTLFACVYTALHLNVPTRSGRWLLLFQKVKWVFTALLAPEVVLYIAISQFFKVRWMQSRLAERCVELQDLSPKAARQVRELDRDAVQH
jgi:hypothetical protein